MGQKYAKPQQDKLGSGKWRQQLHIDVHIFSVWLGLRCITRENLGQFLSDLFSNKNVTMTREKLTDCLKTAE